MLEVIDALASQDAALQCAPDSLQAGSSVPLGSVKLLAPLLNPPSLWVATASTYRAHHAEMQAKKGGGGSDRSAFTKDELMAEFFLKPSSSIIGPGG